MMIPDPSVGDRIAELASQLVQASSRPGIDSMHPVIDLVTGWARDHHLPCASLNAEGDEPVGVVIGHAGRDVDKVLCFNACLDTAAFGDEAKWNLSPTSGTVQDGWLHGRGSADSKIAVAIFLHLLDLLSLDEAFEQGRVIGFFDCDEHSGRFQGIQRLVAEVPTIESVAIGYPGERRLMIGARGFLRATIIFFGASRHTGSKTVAASAIDCAAKFALEVQAWSHAQTMRSTTMFPKASVVTINGGTGFTVTADRCEVKLDLRLTTEFRDNTARGFVIDLANRISRETQTPSPEVEFHPGWPAYVLSEDAPLVAALRSAHREVCHQDLELAIAGPSNIGNFLASRGIQATCGFGVRYENLHAPNERACLDDAPDVLRVYYRAYKKLMAEWS